MNTNTMPNIYEAIKDLQKRLNEMEAIIKNMPNQNKQNEIDQELYAKAAESLLLWGQNFKVVFSFSSLHGIHYNVLQQDYELRPEDIAEFSMSPGKSKEELEEYIRTTIEKLKRNTQ
jgi:hypothetical protein